MQSGKIHSILFFFWCGVQRCIAHGVSPRTRYLRDLGESVPGSSPARFTSNGYVVDVILHGARLRLSCQFAAASPVANIFWLNAELVLQLVGLFVFPAAAALNIFMSFRL